MNRLDPQITAGMPLNADATILSSEIMKNWDAEDFSLACELAKAPAVFHGGLGAALLHLAVAVKKAEDTVARLSLLVDGKHLTLGLSDQALDAFVSLLSAQPIVGAGDALSLDAIEALGAALLSPLTHVEVGSASWGSLHPTTAALQMGDIHLPLAGQAKAIRALHSMMAATNAGVSSPLTLIGQSPIQNLAVSTEHLFALVHLTQAEQSSLETGCGVILDMLWPEGRWLAGQKFLRTDQGWRDLLEITADTLRVRSAAHPHMLESLPYHLRDTKCSRDELELVHNEKIIARGHVRAVTISGHPQMVFEVDQFA